MFLIEFTSARERRLWICTAIALMAVFSTLGLARTLATTLADWRFDVSLFLLGCFLILVSILVHGLKPVRSATEIGVAIGIVAVYLLVFVRMTSPTERSHLVEYGVVALFIFEALIERATHGRRIRCPGLVAVIATGLIGVVDELIQLFLPDRVCDYIDMIFNIGAAAMAVTACRALRWAQSRGK